MLVGGHVGTEAPELDAVVLRLWARVGGTVRGSARLVRGHVSAEAPARACTHTPSSSRARVCATSYSMYL